MNRTRWMGDFIPSDEESRSIMEKDIEVGFDGKDFPICVPPGGIQPLMLSKGQCVYIRPVKESAVVSTMVL